MPRHALVDDWLILFFMHHRERWKLEVVKCVSVAYVLYVCVFICVLLALHAEIQQISNISCYSSHNGMRQRSFFISAL